MLLEVMAMEQAKQEAFCKAVRDLAFRLQVQSISPRAVEIIVAEPEDWMTLLSAVRSQMPAFYEGEDFGDGVFKLAGIRFTNPTIRDYEGSRYVEVWSKAMVAA